jgi:RNA polymerase sigma-70 factor, ECF subfamily
MSGSENESILWVRKLVAGDEQSMFEFWQAYAPGLERLAHSRLAPELHRRVTGEEIAQSVCRTFLRRSQQGQFTLTGSESLWRLLCAITLTKVRQHTRFHLRKRRGLNREVSLSDDAGCEGHAMPQQATAEETLAFADQMAYLLSKLHDEERHIVEGKLEGKSNAQIAAQISCSERTVRRLLNRVESQWSRELESA